MADEFYIDILDDGVISIETEGISDANHVAADNFIDGVVSSLGTVVEEKANDKAAKQYWAQRDVQRGGKIVKIGG